MAFQEILVYLVLGVALGYLFDRFKNRKKNKKDTDCGDGNCGC